MKQFYYRGRGWKFIPAHEEDAASITHDKVVGDVGVSRGQRPMTQMAAQLEDGTVDHISVYPYKEKLGFTEKIVGYIPDEEQEDRYARIVKKTRAKILAPILLLLLLLAGAALFFFRPWQQDVPGLDQAAIAYQMPNGVKNEDPTQIMMPFFDVIEVSNQGQGKVALLNPDGNQCYFKYTLTLSNNDQLVYESGLIKPGTAVVEWYLNTDLAPGEYDATLQIETSDLQDYTQKANGSSFKVKVTVLE